MIGTAASMSWFLWLLTQWPSSASPLLLFSLVGSEMGLEVVQAILCSRWGAPADKSNFQDGDVIIGGLFSLHYIPADVEQSFTKLPYYETCTR